MTSLSTEFDVWLHAHAAELDGRAAATEELLDRLAENGLYNVGTASHDAQEERMPSAAVAVVAALAQRSLSAALVYWAQRVVIECVARSPNPGLVQSILPELVSGRVCGAPGLSNAVKFLGGLDVLQVKRSLASGQQLLNGHLPWATNLGKRGCLVALVADSGHGLPPQLLLVPHSAAGVTVTRSEDLVGLLGTNTGSVRLAGVAADDAWCLHRDAAAILPSIRPVMWGMQCGFGLGLSQASLAEVKRVIDAGGGVFAEDYERISAAVSTYRDELATALDEGQLQTDTRRLTALRLKMVELATEAVMLELQTAGARIFKRSEDNAFARRLGELAFLPIVTPTVTQLKMALAASATVGPSKIE